MTARFDASIVLRYQAHEPATFFLMVQPTQTAHQRIVDETLVITGAADAIVTVDPHSGNRGLKLIAGPGDVTIDYHCTLDLHHHFSEPASLPENGPGRLSRDLLTFLAPSRYCESDRIMPFAREQFGRMAPGFGRIAAIADWCRRNVAFAYGTTNWNTSALDVLAQRRGVCRDYAHLMIAILRALNVPARFVSGFDYGADRDQGPPDFHAYVEAFLGDRWYLFDPSGISPTTGLIRIGTGRDAADVGFATLFGRVQAALPEVACSARDDPAAGFSAPAATALAVSTAASGALLAGDSRLLRQPAGPSIATHAPGPSPAPAATVAPPMRPLAHRAATWTMTASS